MENSKCENLFPTFDTDHVFQLSAINIFSTTITHTLVKNPFIRFNNSQLFHYKIFKQAVESLSNSAGSTRKEKLSYNYYICDTAYQANVVFWFHVTPGVHFSRHQ
jgi:hypothetical protein